MLIFKYFEFGNTFLSIYNCDILFKCVHADTQSYHFLEVINSEAQLLFSVFTFRHKLVFCCFILENLFLPGKSRITDLMTQSNVAWGFAARYRNHTNAWFPSN